MNNNLNNFFKETNFDIYEPEIGHKKRFKAKLNKKTSKKTKWYFTVSIAASILLILGITINNYNNYKKNNLLTSLYPEITEAKTYFNTAIHFQIKEVEKHRSLETETLIENALEKIEELEDNFRGLKKDLQKGGNQKIILRQIINNYHNRLEILEKLLTTLNKNEENILKNNSNETFI